MVDGTGSLDHQARQVSPQEFLTRRSARVEPGCNAVHYPEEFRLGRACGRSATAETASNPCGGIMRTRVCLIAAIPFTALLLTPAPWEQLGKSPEQELPAHISRLTLFGERADFSHDGKRVL